jgi:hypothetical protein
MTQRIDLTDQGIAILRSALLSTALTKMMPFWSVYQEFLQVTCAYNKSIPRLKKRVKYSHLINC